MFYTRATRSLKEHTYFTGKNFVKEVMSCIHLGRHDSAPTSSLDSRWQLRAALVTVNYCPLTD